MAITLSHKAPNSPLGRVFRDRLLPFMNTMHELLHRQCFGILPRKQTLVKLLCPLVVTLGDARMPSVNEVELHRDHVTDAGGSAIGVVHLRRFEPRIESPCSIHAIEVDNCSEIVVKDKIDVKSTGDTAGN